LHRVHTVGRRGHLTVSARTRNAQRNRARGWRCERVGGAAPDRASEPPVLKRISAMHARPCTPAPQSPRHAARAGDDPPRARARRHFRLDGCTAATPCVRGMLSAQFASSRGDPTECGCARLEEGEARLPRRQGAPARNHAAAPGELDLLRRRARFRKAHGAALGQRNAAARSKIRRMRVHAARQAQHPEDKCAEEHSARPGAPSPAHRHRSPGLLASRPPVVLSVDRGKLQMSAVRDSVSHEHVHELSHLHPSS